MSSYGEKLRSRFLERMGSIGVGAKLARRTRHWTVTNNRRLDGSVALTLRNGRREIRVFVPFTLDGPELWWADLRVIAPPPAQRNLFALEGQA